MKLNKQACAALVTSMTLASRLDVAVASSSAVSASDELHPRPTRKTKTVKKDSSSSTTDAESPVVSSTNTITTDAEVLVIASCTVLHEDPYSSGSLLPCCEGLYKDNQPWDGPDEKWRFQCETKATPTPVLSPSGVVPLSPATIITTTPPYWITPQPTPRNECCTAGIGCTKNDNCCPYFGIPGSGTCAWNEYSGCCWGTCTYPVGRVRCNPWVPTIPTNTCIPATGLLFSKNNNKTTKDGLKYPFQTCYKYGNDGTNVCYTQSWTDGSGYYYQCSPKDPYETFTYKVPWCGEPCKDVAPVTNTCNYKGESCHVDDDCCGDLQCECWGFLCLGLCT